MNNKCWFIPIGIVALHASIVIIQWSTLPELLPAHYDLQGNAGGTMSRNVLLLYLLMAAAVCLLAYVAGRRWRNLRTGMVILASGACLTLLSSTMVTLTSGAMPIFMLAEPIILLVAAVGFVVSYVSSRKKNATL